MTLVGRWWWCKCPRPLSGQNLETCHTLNVAEKNSCVLITMAFDEFDVGPLTFLMLLVTVLSLERWQLEMCKE